LPPTFDPREEPGALAAHAGICAGGEEQSSSLPRPFEDDARRCDGRAMRQFRNSGDKIGQTVAVARYISKRVPFSATSGLFGHNWGAD
jgi:hypothetical protein